MKEIYKNITTGASAFLFTALFLLSGCTDKYEEWNTDSHAATDKDLEKDNLKTGTFFTQMQQYVFVVNNVSSDYQIAQNLNADLFSGYIGACGIWNSGSNNSNYNLIAAWNKAPFEFAYVKVMNPWSLIKKFAEAANQAHVSALADVVKVEAMHRVTDIYGPIPYSNFGDGVLKAKYDSQEKIYDAFFVELDNAIKVLTDFHTKNPNSKILTDYDHVYNGNVEKWIRFANTLRLRLAMRIAYVAPEKARQQAELAVNHSIGVIKDAGDVAKVRNERITFEYPLYVICHNFNEIRMGASMDSYLNGYKDPRLSKYFVQSSGGDYRGIRSGINVNSNYAKAAFSKLNCQINSDMMWMSPAESYFLMAEGAIRGWDMGGSAQEFYENGIKTSFTHNGVGDAESYIANDTDVPADYTDIVSGGNSNIALSDLTIKWDDSDDFERKLERIITQKWIAMYPDGQEAWSEFRRTGYPKIFPVKVNNSGGTINTQTQIRRLPFPSPEYIDNPENVKEAVSLLGGSDNGGTRLWWDKK